jgi:hypothetical protein
MPAPGAPLNLDSSNRATIPAGGHLTFGVTFQPRPGVNEPDAQRLEILDVTTNRGRELGTIVLEGLGVPDNTGGQVPPIVAPVTPQFISPASLATWMTKPAALPWLFGSLMLVGLLAFFRKEFPKDFFDCSQHILDTVQSNDNGGEAVGRKSNSTEVTPGGQFASTAVKRSKGGRMKKQYSLRQIGSRDKIIPHLHSEKVNQMKLNTRLECLFTQD